MANSFLVRIGALPLPLLAGILSGSHWLLEDFLPVLITGFHAQLLYRLLLSNVTMSKV